MRIQEHPKFTSKSNNSFNLIKENATGFTLITKNALYGIKIKLGWILSTAMTS